MNINRIKISSESQICLSDSFPIFLNFKEILMKIRKIRVRQGDREGETHSQEERETERNISSATGIV